MNKEGSFKPVAIVMIISMLIALLWNSLTFLKSIIHSILDPTAGALISWNLHLGMLIIIFILAIITTLIQKYTTDQESLRAIRKEQKEVQEEMKKVRDNPQKLLELQKKSFEFLPKTLKLSMRSIAYSAIPLILLFRWFDDYFAMLGDPNFILGMSWFLFYIIGSILFSSILKKPFNVV